MILQGDYTESKSYAREIVGAMALIIWDNAKFQMDITVGVKYS